MQVYENSEKEMRSVFPECITVNRITSSKNPTDCDLPLYINPKIGAWICTWTFRCEKVLMIQTNKKKPSWVSLSRGWGGGMMKSVELRFAGHGHLVEKACAGLRQ